jgi:hypothetical protein
LSRLVKVTETKPTSLLFNLSIFSTFMFYSTGPMVVLTVYLNPMLVGLISITSCQVEILMLLFGQASFHGMARQIEYGSIHLTSKEFAVHAGHKVLMEVDLYFTDCWRSARDFRSAAQASPNPLNKYYFIN